MNQPDRERYIAYQDSLEILDNHIRKEQDAKFLLIQKEKQKYYWQQIQKIHEKYPTVPKLTKELPEASLNNNEWDILVQNLTQALSFTIAALVLFIGILLYLLKKRKNKKLPQESPPSIGEKFDSAIANAQRNMQPQKTLEELARAVEKVAPVDQDDANLRPVARKLASTSPTRPSIKKAAVDIPAPEEIQEPMESAAPAQAEKKPVENIPHVPRSAVSYNEIPTEPEPSSSLEDMHDKYEKQNQINSDIIKLARRGYTSSEIARRLKLPQDQIDLMIRLKRES